MEPSRPLRTHEHPKPCCRQWQRNDYGYQQTTRVFPAGEYGLTAKLGAAEINPSVVIDAGQTTVLDLVIGVGVAVVDASYAEGVKVEGGEHFVEIFGAKKDIDGNRKVVDYTYGAGASFDLPGGDYVAVVTLGAAKVEAPFSVKVGERTDILVPLNAGVVAFTTGGTGANNHNFDVGYRLMPCPLIAPAFRGDLSICPLLSHTDHIYRSNRFGISSFVVMVSSGLFNAEKLLQD